MIRCSVTVSLVEEARGGPFVFWHDLRAATTFAAEHGFHAIELFPPCAAEVPQADLKKFLNSTGLDLAAVGTGGGWVRERLAFTDPDADVRVRATRFVRDMIDVAAEFGAPVIIGSMQGRWGGAIDRAMALEWLGSELVELGEHAMARGTRVLFEPLNRYESNLLNRLGDAAEFVDGLGTKGVQLLADLFHMNIEEVDLAAAIRTAGRHVGHVHFADSNRQAAGSGHTDFAPIASALREVGYEGFVSAEVFPLPDPESAAHRTIESYQRFFVDGGS